MEGRRGEEGGVEQEGSKQGRNEWRKKKWLPISKSHIPHPIPPTILLFSTYYLHMNPYCACAPPFPPSSIGPSHQPIQEDDRTKQTSSLMSS
ncbi:hypothetical protein L249_3483 [Ophiocordyceps polyrhachis-furcata BCC 54312]|uniref:Uncharacterized protein n=1 Tax=Ophiocordyceps polyrhachis-furcata BCC 54312 TaxID=1330021 RepID=A0A367LN80_9HYPO|nr:hypothetical protein L249_3483 [Ophiocordyceps polyrhachis-furcata BCC 54312]